MKRVNIAVFCAATTAALIISSLGPAQAQASSPPAVKDPWLVSLADLEDDATKYEGFSQIVVNSPGDVTVQVKAGTPAAGMKLTKRASLKADLRTTAFSLEELAAERDRITEHVKVTKLKNVHQIGPSPDLSGILIDVEPGEATDFQRAIAPTPQELGLPASPIPVSVRLAPGKASPSAYTRQDTGGSSGQTLHIGGQRIAMANGARCTAGVPVYDSATAKHVVLTAGHCGGIGSSWRDGVGFGYGSMYANTSSQTAASYDYSLISNSNAITIGAIYRGRISETRTSRMAPQRVNAGLGMRLCGSGSFSGEVCDIGVVAVNQNVYYAAMDTWYNNLTQLASFGAYSGWGVGDSGGPVFFPNSDGSAAIAGIISGQRQGTVMPCRESTDRTCYKDLFMAPFSFIQDTRGLVISQGM
ncbi:hypothetical protein [Paenarthrobacter ilicis]|uniref:hypothetical protein n=1 Tax=Paenarthrobacter ilicis TaxID=43665 RepID=UPI003865401A